MIKDGIEYKKCDKCGKLCAKLEMVNWKTCKECVISELKEQIEQLTFLHNEDVNTIKLLNKQIKEIKENG